MQRPTQRNMFTLIEVMIVIAIIGIIAGMGIPKFNQYRKTAYARSRVSNCERLLTAVDAYVTANNVAYTNLGVAATVAAAFPANGVDGAFAFMKGGKDSLKVNGEAIAIPATLDTEDISNADGVNDWKPYIQNIAAGNQVYKSDGSYTGMEDN